METLKFAGELAQKSGNAELYEAVMIRFNAFASAMSNEKESEIEKCDQLPESVHDIVEENEQLLELPNKIDLLTEINESNNLDNVSPPNNSDVLLLSPEIKREMPQFSKRISASLENPMSEDTEVNKEEVSAISNVLGNELRSNSNMIDVIEKNTANSNVLNGIAVKNGDVTTNESVMKIEKENCQKNEQVI